MNKDVILLIIGIIIGSLSGYGLCKLFSPTIEPRKNNTADISKAVSSVDKNTTNGLLKDREDIDNEGILNFSHLGN